VSFNKCKPEEVGVSAQRLQKLSGLVQTWIRPDLHQSIVMHVARNGRFFFQKSTGNITPDPGSPSVQESTIYPVASLSKVFTATAIMTLVEDGMISLHNPVQDFIPEFSGTDKDKIRLWNLLTHTIGGLSMEEMDGLPYRNSIQSSSPSPVPEGQHPKIHEFLCVGYDAPLSRKPGSVVIYSNYGFELLGEIVRRVSGVPLATYVEDRIFEPLGMIDTHFILPVDKYARVVQRPIDAASASAKKLFFQGLGSESLAETPWASGGAYSTASDLATFGQMFLNCGEFNGAQVLSPATTAYMTRNQTPGLPDGDRDEALQDASRGIGWDIPGVKRDLMYANLYSPRTYSHSGAGGSLLWVDPVYNLVGVFLSIELIVRPDAQRSWAADRFVNAITASILK
jgi:CubicO group peptidase (beta-lactamase class C family)